MWLSEHILYRLAKRLYRTEACISSQMREAVEDKKKYDAFRSRKIPHIMEAAKRYGIPIKDKVVLDLGCSNGAITREYLTQGATRVIGIDVDQSAIDRARASFAVPQLSFHVSVNDQFPLPDASVDTIISNAVFEHVSRPRLVLDECYRILKPGGKMLLGTWGWYHPFAPHLFFTMPVPWAHVIFSERTILRTCRKVYQSSWYTPTMHDLDENGQKKPDQYGGDEISTDYLNKLLIRDFEKIFRASQFEYRLFPIPFSHPYARWTRIFLKVPGLREVITSFFWAVLQKPQEPWRQT
jgi:SAM-dependent methyltransferase